MSHVYAWIKPQGWMATGFPNRLCSFFARYRTLVSDSQPRTCGDAFWSVGVGFNSGNNMSYAERHTIATLHAD